MSTSFFKRLTDHAQRLDEYHGYLAAAMGTSGDWRSTVPLPRACDPLDHIAKWRLAENFLYAWSEWHTSHTRFVRYFAQPDEHAPQAWARLERHCRELLSRLRDDSELDGCIAEGSLRDLGAEAGGGDEVDFLIEEVENNNVLLTMLRNADLGESGIGWRRSKALAWNWDRRVKDRLADLPAETLDEIAWHVRIDRSMWLDFSWLDPDRWNEADESRRTAFEHVLGRPAPPPPWVGRFAETMSDDPPAAERVRRVLERIAQAVAEVDFEGFAIHATSTEMHEGPGTPLGDAAVRVVRKGTPAAALASAAIVVGVAHQRRKHRFHSRSNILAKIGEALSAATAPVVAVVLLGSWDAAEVEREQIETFRRLQQRGHRFLFLLAASDTELSPIDMEQLLAAGDSRASGRPLRQTS